MQIKAILRNCDRHICKFVAAALVLFALCPSASSADDSHWDGVHYIPVPVRFGSDTRLVMPESFDDSWERDSDVACSLLDARTLIIRPRKSHIEQRLTLRGRTTGSLYLARVSDSLPYAPIIRVSVREPSTEGTGSGRDTTDVIQFLKSMMSARVPAGTTVSKSERILIDQPPYRMTAEEVWRNGPETGIFVRIDATTPTNVLPIVPANFVVRIPELGSLRAMSAEFFELSPRRTSTRAYLVYAR